MIDSSQRGSRSRPRICVINAPSSESDGRARNRIWFSMLELFVSMLADEGSVRS